MFLYPDPINVMDALVRDKFGQFTFLSIRCVVTFRCDALLDEQHSPHIGLYVAQITSLSAPHSRPM